MSIRLHLHLLSAGTTSHPLLNGMLYTTRINVHAANMKKEKVYLLCILYTLLKTMKVTVIILNSLSLFKMNVKIKDTKKCNCTT